MERTLIKDLHDHIGKEVSVAGWVDVRRDHGKLIFIDLRDRSGKVQMVAIPSHEEAHALASAVRPEWVVEVIGKVNARPEKMVNKDLPTGDIELEMLGVKVLSKAQELPFEKDTEVNLDTLFDYRPLTLRNERERNIFSVQATILDAYRESLMRQDFTEFQAPALTGADAEGGAAAFKVEYFYDKTAYLATSPQFYKEIMVGPFERAFTIAKIFRAEKHATTRHLSEITQMDFEMGFIKDHLDVMAALETTIKDTVEDTASKHSDVFAKFGTTPPAIPQKFPILTLREAQKILGVGEEPDMEPEHERQICEWALKEHGSDFVFITHFPTAKRAFYTYADEKDPTYSKSFDLLFRGLEINSGSQRIHDYDEMVHKIESVGLDPKKFSFYLQAFKYGLPPHGGCSTGLERITARILNLSNVKEASAFPRDVNRIDTLLSES
ncbi:aspartate--tRNA(Asn) ligase [Candidatus Kaiserbacteria bacterium]|nr:aspartate--tRNA(Asn) ligase [Candidatus Kaiserbacteria bacterium]